MKIKNVLNSWYDWTRYLNNQTLTFRNLIINLPLSSCKFLIDLFYIALMPYRFLRTLVNAGSHLCAINVNEFFLKRYPHLSNSNSWLAFNLAFQGALSLALILFTSLYIIPLPIAWAPLLFFSPLLPLVALGYVASIMFFTMGKSLYLQHYKESIALKEIPTKSRKSTVGEKPQVSKKKMESFKPMYEKFRENQSTLTKPKESHHIKNVNILKKTV